MKKIVAIASSVLLMTGMSAYAAGTNSTDTSIAVVNVSQIFQQSPKIADLNKKLQSQFKGRQDKLIAQQKSLQEELDKFKKESPTMSEKAKNALQSKIMDDQGTLQKDAAAFQKDLSAEQNKIMKGVLTQLNEIISSIAKNNHYNMVLDSQAVIFANPSADITKDVTTEFDKK